MSGPTPAPGRDDTTAAAQIREVEGAWELRCPECGRWSGIDDDQLHGRVSVDHTGTWSPLIPGGCTFHETRDWAATAEDVTPR